MLNSCIYVSPEIDFKNKFYSKVAEQDGSIHNECLTYITGIFDRDLAKKLSIKVVGKARKDS